MSTVQPLRPVTVPRGQGDAYWWIGSLATVKLTREQTGGALSVLEVTLPEGYAVPPHVHHDEDETFVVVDGELTFEVGTDTAAAGPGDLLFGPRDVPHHFRVDRGPATLLYVLTPGA